MTTANKLAIVVLLVLMSFNLNSGAQENAHSNDCGLIKQALADYQHVKVGATRAEVGRYFVPDGGAQFPSRTRYIYPRCNYLHVDVEFELTKPTEVSSSPEDKVVGVSKLYIEYPAKD